MSGHESGLGSVGKCQGELLRSIGCVMAGQGTRGVGRCSWAEQAGRGVQCPSSSGPSSLLAPGPVGAEVGRQQRQHRQVVGKEERLNSNAFFVRGAILNHLLCG